MSLKSGFYNSVNGDRKYNADDISRMFDGIIQDGIFATVGTSFIVKADFGNNVNVGIGKAWFNHTWTYNDSVLPVTLPDSDLTQNRIDAVVLEINTTDEVRKNTIKVISGEVNSTPERPSLIKSDGLNQYPLAYINRKANTSDIKQEDITNMVGTEETPFVVGVLKTISFEELMAQWQGDFITWYEEIKGKLSEDAAGNLQNQINEIKGFELNGTLASGQTLLEFSDFRIREDSILDRIYNSIFGVQIANAIIETGKLTIEYQPQDTDMNVKVVII